MDDYTSETESPDEGDAGGNGIGAIVGAVLILVGIVVANWPRITCPPSGGSSCGANFYLMFATMPVGAVIGLIGIGVIAASARSGNNSEEDDTSVDSSDDRPDHPNYNADK